MFPVLLQLKKSVRQVSFPHISLSEAAKLLFTFVNLSHQEGGNVPGFIISREIKQDCSTASSPCSWQYFPPAELINRHGSSNLLRMGFCPCKGPTQGLEHHLTPCAVMDFWYQRWIFGIGESSSLFQFSKPPNKAVLKLCCQFGQCISKPSENDS